MTPTQFNNYLRSLRLSDEDLAWLLELPRGDFGATLRTVQQYKRGKIDYPSWLQPVFMKMLSVYQQQFPVLMASHTEQQPYAVLQKSEGELWLSGNDTNFYLPEEDEEEIETFLYPDEERQRLRQRLIGEIELIEFTCPNEMLKGLGKERFKVYEGCVGMYNGFVAYAAARLRERQIPYERITFVSAKQFQQTSDEISKAMQNSTVEHWEELNRVVPLHPTPEYLAEKAEVEEVIQSYI